MARELITKHGVDPTQVYPKADEGWYTLNDFLEAIKDIPHIRKMLPEGTTLNQLLPGD